MKPRSVLIDGSATFTIVVSSTIIKVPRQRTISASQRPSRRVSPKLPGWCIPSTLVILSVMIFPLQPNKTAQPLDAIQRQLCGYDPALAVRTTSLPALLLCSISEILLSNLV